MRRPQNELFKCRNIPTTSGKVYRSIRETPKRYTMTKFYFVLLLSLFSLTLHAQKSTFKKVYVDGELGLISLGDSWFPFGATDLSLGYRISPQLAMGASIIGWVKPSDCCSSGASGTGIQLRYTPSASRLMLKAETGYLLGTSYGRIY